MYYLGRGSVHSGLSANGALCYACDSKIDGLNGCVKSTPMFLETHPRRHKISHGDERNNVHRAGADNTTGAVGIGDVKDAKWRRR